MIFKKTIYLRIVDGLTQPRNRYELQLFDCPASSYDMLVDSTVPVASTRAVSDDANRPPAVLTLRYLWDSLFITVRRSPGNVIADRWVRFGEHWHLLTQGW